MKKLIIFLGAMGFVTQAHGMEDDKLFSDNKYATTKPKSNQVYAITDLESIFKVKNSTKKNLSVSAFVRGEDYSSLPGKPKSFFSFDVKRGEAKAYLRKDLGKEWEIGNVNLTEITDVTISFDDGASFFKSPEKYKVNFILDITEDLLKSWKEAQQK